MTGRRPAVLTFLLGLACLALAGFFSPCWFAGFIPLGVGLVWASYDLVEVEVATSGDAAATPR